MSTTLTVNAGYVGALAGEIFVQAFKKSDTISKGCITVLPNVIGSGFLPKLSYASGLAAYACGFSATGTVTYTDKEVVAVKYKIENELCKDEFHQTFQAQSAGLFAAQNDIPATIQEAILLAMVNNMGAIVDYEIWQGTGSSTSFNGLIKQLTGDTEVLKITGTSITKTNVVAELDKVYNLVPDSIEGDTDLVFVAAKNVTKAYKQAIAALYGQTPNGDKELDYLGIRLESIGGLPNNTILAYRVKNVGFVTGLESDMNNVSVKDMDESDLSGNIRTKIVFTAGVGYSFGAEIVLYRP
jgi:hypothetical protein